jgi:hypothetical protein
MNLFETDSVKILHKLEIIPSGELLEEVNYVQLSNPKICCNNDLDAWNQMGESFYAVMRLQINRDGYKYYKYICEKSNYTFGCDLNVLANEEKRRLQLLSEYGVPVPHIYGVHGASIYREFIFQNNLKQVENMLSDSNRFTTGTSEYKFNCDNIRKLARIALVLDTLHFNPLNFMGDLIYDPIKEQFWYVDGGFDLGREGQDVHDIAKLQLERLIQHDPRLLAIIDQIYV